MGDFIIELPHPLFLEGEWECALVDVLFSNKVTQNLIILCDLCQNSYIHNTSQPVLRTISKGTSKHQTFFNPIYLKISRDSIQRLKLFIRDEQLNDLSLTSQQLKCTLHFRRVL